MEPKSMTEENQETTEMKKSRRKRRCLIIVGAFLFLLFIVFLIFLILALTLFRAKHPTTQIISVELAGVAPRLSFPLITNFQLNVTLILQVKVNNPNYAGFRHGTGKGYLLYRGNQVGEADILPGTIRARKSTTLPCRLTLQVARVVSDAGKLISDVMDGEFTVNTRAVIPGRVNFLGFIKKHAVAKSECSYTITVPEFKIKDQSCKTKTKL